MTDLTERFEDALALATRLHRPQRRKGTDIAYVSHLLGVAAVAPEIGADEDQAIAALLHDSLEDQGHQIRSADIRARFGERVAAMVEACTDGEPDADTGKKAPWRERKEAYIAAMAHKGSDALLVSLADKTHNARAILDDLAVHGDALWSRFTGGCEGSLWYYDALARAFKQHLPGPGATRLTAIVADIHKAAREGA